MPHDKIKAAARKRVGETGEPYAAARRAVVTERQAPGGQAAAGQAPGGQAAASQAAASQAPPTGPGYALAMSGEFHGWLAELRDSDPTAAPLVVRALVTLMDKGASLGDPLVASTADSWPWALMQALDRSYQERVQRLTAARRGEADAAALIKEIQDQVAALETAQANLEDRRRRALDAGRPQEATQAAGGLAAARQQIAQARRTLPGVVEARRRLGQASQRLEAGADAWRVRKEVLKASYTAASSSLRASQAIAALGLGDGDGDGRDENSGQAVSGAADARLAEITAQMEQALGQQGGPEGLMELRPGAPLHGGIRILFAVEPAGTALLIAVLHGLEAADDQFPEAVMASAQMLRRIRAGQAPEAAAHTYADTRSLLAEFHPGDPAAEGF